MTENETSFGTWLIGALTVVMFVMAFAFGWIVGHGTISRECTKIGAFFVGDKVYECKVKQ